MKRFLLRASFMQLDNAIFKLIWRLKLINATWVGKKTTWNKWTAWACPLQQVEKQTEVRAQKV